MDTPSIAKFELSISQTCSQSGGQPLELRPFERDLPAIDTTMNMVALGMLPTSLAVGGLELLTVGPTPPGCGCTIGLSSIPSTSCLTGARSSYSTLMLAFDPRALTLLSVSLLGCACATPSTPKPAPTTELAPHAFDKHRVIHTLPTSTAAILETSYYQANIEYLLKGSERALLFDSGPGKHKMAPVIATLTDLPVTVVPSHLHFDHVGGLNEFSDVALIDAEDLRKRTIDGVFTPNSTEHLGWLDRDPQQPFRVSRWLQPGELIDLGDRRVEVILTPGHTKTSVMLYDSSMPALFSGDFLYPGGLFVESLEEYRGTLETLLARMPEDVTIYPAHNGRGRKVTTLAYSDLSDLHKAVCGALDGTIKGKPADAFGIPSTAYPVSRRLNMFVLKWPRNPADGKKGQ